MIATLPVLEVCCKHHSLNNNIRGGGCGVGVGVGTASENNVVMHNNVCAQPLQQ